MKKLFALTVILALALTACDNGATSDGGSSGNNADVIGTWIGTSEGEYHASDGNYYMCYEGEVTLYIAVDFTWLLRLQDSKGMRSFNGFWTREGEILFLKEGGGTGEPILLLSNYVTFLEFPLSQSGGGGMVNAELNKQDTVVGSTSLKIQNESFSEITEVRWSGTSFTKNHYSQERFPIINGSYVTKMVQEGSGYIYFRRKTNPINARTEQLVVIEKNEQKVFVITDDTLIVDTDNPNNKGTFGSLNKQ
jgi:hypothetical protein